ncbi:MAG: desulfoferrodoxin family protein [Muribaculaceae bacterium]
MATEFFKCNHCGNVVMKMVDSGAPLVCCGEKMQLLVPNTEDASTEKHVPVAKRIDECLMRVDVGSVPHPMLREHHIQFIYVETEHGGVRYDLSDKPEAELCVCHDRPISIYDYCNLHGLWHSEL